jgi:hypothetical protein
MLNLCEYKESVATGCGTRYNLVWKASIHICIYWSILCALQEVEAILLLDACRL